MIFSVKLEKKILKKTFLEFYFHCLIEGSKEKFRKTLFQSDIPQLIVLNYFKVVHSWYLSELGKHMINAGNLKCMCQKNKIGFASK